MFRSYSNLMDSESVDMIKQVKIIYLRSSQCLIDLSEIFFSKCYCSHSLHDSSRDRKSETSNSLSSVLDNVADSASHIVVSLSSHAQKPLSWLMLWFSFLHFRLCCIAGLTSCIDGCLLGRLLSLILLCRKL